MRRSLPFLIIAGVFVIAIVAAIVLYRYRVEPEPPPPPAASATPSPRPTAIVSVSPTAPSPTVAETSPVASATAIPSIAPVAPTAGPTFSYGRPGAEPMHVRGDPGAPVVLEEFGDFECLPCSLLWPILLKLEHDYAKRLVVVFREHPLKMHHFALDAARAAEAAGLQGKFWEMHDALYRNRATWVPAAYVTPYLNQYAVEVGLDLDRFKNDLDGPQVAARMAADQDRGESLGVDRTPTVYLNGQKIPATDFKEEGLRAAIEKALAPKP